MSKEKDKAWCIIRATTNGEIEYQTEIFNYGWHKRCIYRRVYDDKVLAMSILWKLRAESKHLTFHIKCIKYKDGKKL